jgi:AraC-like DNA-binding protein
MDKNELDRLLSDFYTVSGMETSVLDADFHTVAMARSPKKNLCSLIHRADTGGGLCKASDIEKLTSARQSGATVVYRCPYGITEAIIPIYSPDGISGYLFSSMGFSVGDYDSRFDNLLSFDSLKKTDFLTLERLASEMRVLTEEEVTAYVSMLTIIADHIGNSDTTFFGNENIGALIKQYVKKNLSSKITLNDIARELHCSTVTLTQKFKAEFGITIMEYVTKKRIALSERLLVTTDHNLRTVASDCGFADVEYFSRTFKKIKGISPAAWRSINKN